MGATRGRPVWASWQYSRYSMCYLSSTLTAKTLEPLLGNMAEERAGKRKSHSPAKEHVSEELFTTSPT